MTPTSSTPHRSAQLLTGLGIALPVLMMLAFIAYASWQRSGMPAPQHGLFVMEPSWNEAVGAHGVRYTVEDERIVAYPSLEQNMTYKLYRIDPSELRATRIDVPFAELPLTGPTPVPTLVNVRVTADLQAPDGYQMTDDYRDGPGVIGELFGRRRFGEIGFSREGVRHWVNASDVGLSHWNAVFLGWEIDD
ncbi:MAG: hypothetical protein NXH85_16135 [Pseudomonadaceae bacterium]|nr:hypothetical protein [Pseudomonadaceae bacterium]